MRLEWIFPVIVLIFYVLSAVMKAREDTEKPKRPANRGPGQELDKFLEEIERLRREQAAKAKQPRREGDDESPPRPGVAVPVPPVLPRPRPVAVARPPLSSSPAVVSAASAAQLAAPKPAPVVIVPPTPVRRAPDALAPVFALLRQPRTLTTAMVLHEVFGPPKGLGLIAAGLAAPAPSPTAPADGPPPLPRR